MHGPLEVVEADSKEEMQLAYEVESELVLAHLMPMKVDSEYERLEVPGRIPESLENGTGKALGIEVVAD